MTIDQLKNSYQEEMEKSFKPLVEDIKWGKTEVYAEWMAQTYFYAAHTTRIIGLAGALFNRERNDFHTRFMEHAGEEKGHDRIMLLDMKEAGYKIEDFRPSTNSLALYQTQYYWIQNVNPISVYGYFLYLEGLAVEHGAAIYGQLKAAYPPKMIKYLKVHVEEDVGHMGTHFNILKSATSEELKLIEENMRLTGGIYRQLTQDIANAEKITTQKAG